MVHLYKLSTTVLEHHKFAQILKKAVGRLGSEAVSMRLWLVVASLVLPRPCYCLLQAPRASSSLRSQHVNMQVQFSQVAVPLRSTAELCKSVEAKFASENKRIVRWHVASVDEDAHLANCEVVWMPALSSQAMRAFVFCYYGWSLINTSVTEGIADCTTAHRFACLLTQHPTQDAVAEQQQPQQGQQCTLQQQQPPATSKSRRDLLSLLSFGAPLALFLAARDSNNFQLRDLTPFAGDRQQSQGLQDLGALVRGRVKATNDALVEGTRRLNEEHQHIHSASALAASVTACVQH
eukprot:4582-Heterococcus_DN1.PRE.4